MTRTVLARIALGWPIAIRKSELANVTSSVGTSFVEVEGRQSCAGPANLFQRSCDEQICSARGPQPSRWFQSCRFDRAACTGQRRPDIESDAMNADRCTQERRGE